MGSICIQMLPRSLDVNRFCSHSNDSTAVDGYERYDDGGE